jgi:hypothetical protein
MLKSMSLLTVNKVLLIFIQYLILHIEGCLITFNSTKTIATREMAFFDVETRVKPDTATPQTAVTITILQDAASRHAKLEAESRKAEERLVALRRAQKSAVLL